MNIIGWGTSQIGTENAIGSMQSHSFGETLQDPREYFGLKHFPFFKYGHPQEIEPLEIHLNFYGFYFIKSIFFYIFLYFSVPIDIYRWFTSNNYRTIPWPHGSSRQARGRGRSLRSPRGPRCPRGRAEPRSERSPEPCEGGHGGYGWICAWRPWSPTAENLMGMWWKDVGNMLGISWNYTLPSGYLT